MRRKAAHVSLPPPPLERLRPRARSHGLCLRLAFTAAAAVLALSCALWRRAAQSRQVVKGYVWLRLSLPGEGVNGWRELVAASAVAARSIGYGLAAPCVRDSELVPCFEEDEEPLDYKSALRAANTRRNLVARGRPRRGAFNLSIYFDVRHLEAFVGAPVVAPACLPSVQATPVPSAVVEAPGGLAQLAQSSELLAIHDSRQGIFALGPYRDPDLPATAAALFSDDTVVTNKPLKLASARRREARHFIGGDYDVIMWRSELVPKDALHACASAINSAAAAIIPRKLVFITDIAASALAGGSTSLWAGHSRRSRRQDSSLDSVRRHLLRNLTEHLGVAKYDIDLASRSSPSALDRGSIGLAEQYIAVHATNFFVQRSFRKRDPTDFRPNLGRCGWEGRFLNTILAARHAKNASSLSWFDTFFIERARSGL